MTIRESNQDDLAAIYRVHKEAFGAEEGESVAQLACDILADESALPGLSLVAEKHDEIIGSIIFSSVQLGGDKTPSVRILCPLAIAPAHHKMGIGTQLIHSGLDKLQASGVAIVLVLGDPAYYSRSGFKAGHKILPPYELAYPEAWMALELKPGALAKAAGVAVCARCLQSPQYW